MNEEEEIDLDEHWSYTIMGNWRAGRYYGSLSSFCFREETDEESELIQNNQIDLVDLMKDLINRCYDKLIAFVKEQHSRLAYLVLGVFIMKFGGKMTKEVRDEILKYSEWKYEKHQFKTEEEMELRKKYLTEFRGKIINYLDRKPTLVSKITLSDVYANHGPFDLTPIKYDI